MSSENYFEYKSIPGRGLVTKAAIKARIDYLLQNGFEIEHINRYFLDHSSIQNNIESFVGTVEIPLGIVGPLLFIENNKHEAVYTVAGTLEGALVASMNRGAKAISMSGGFSAKILYQKMIRSPLFIFNTAEETKIFEDWVSLNFERIKNISESYSNHAKLISISAITLNVNVHLRFVYTTGDASGQNMTTTCTWHAMLWIVDTFLLEKGIEIFHFVIEGNGSSDKKASQFLIDHGRGTGVVANCFLSEDVINKILRTTSDSIYRFYDPAVELAKKDGMLGFNINVANTIAAIYVATGQDLASIHESAVGVFHIEKTNGGLLFQLNLPSLVIGTIGGGTSLDSQNEGLKIMGCEGNGKLERFAKLIAGFALSLEISTSSAIASGEFAKAHEKLGRNKPRDWLLKNELTSEFISQCLKNSLGGISIKQISFDADSLENGILTNITKRVNKKIMGFIPARVLLVNNIEKHILVKSKALDIDVIKGLHIMAASIDPKLADLLHQHHKWLEYWNCHLKELNLNKILSENKFDSIPIFYGNYIDEKREIYFLFQEKLDKKDLLLLDSENSPQLWTNQLVNNCITEIHRIHYFLSSNEQQIKLPEVTLFEPWRSKSYYEKIISIVCTETNNPIYSNLYAYLNELEEGAKQLNIPTTVIHNDFNPRNIAIRKDGHPCIYDWELAVLNIPHRDIVEFICFILPDDFEPEQFIQYLKYHFTIAKIDFKEIIWNEWKKGYIYSLKEFLVTRAAYYKAAEVLFKLKFSDRIMRNGFEMIRLLESSTTIV